MKRSFTLFADYFQFYLQDETCDGIDGESWTDAAFEARLALEPHAFAVTTARNMEVPVTVAVCKDAPPVDLDAWDHVVEFSIDVPSGRLIVAGCTDFVPDAERIEIGAGGWAVRALSGRLDDLSDDGLEGRDHYRIEMWPGQARPLKVVKTYG